SPVHSYQTSESKDYPCSSSSSKILNEHPSRNQSDHDGHVHRLFLLFARMLFFMVICSSICMT
ncbi:hypothetical protein ADUPG1_000204, partial [Aduncisulcus paluster]